MLLDNPPGFLEIEVCAGDQVKRRLRLADLDVFRANIAGPNNANLRLRHGWQDIGNFPQLPS
jgi:hypothetical protein